MTTPGDAQAKKRKPFTYGKRIQKPSFAILHSPNSPASPLRRPLPRSGTGSPARTPGNDNAIDPFDVPSSDDEKTPKLPSRLPQRPLAQKRKSPLPESAPRRNVVSSAEGSQESQSRKRRCPTPSEQLLQEAESQSPDRNGAAPVARSAGKDIFDFPDDEPRGQITTTAKVARIKQEGKSAVSLKATTTVAPKSQLKLDGRGRLTFANNSESSQRPKSPLKAAPILKSSENSPRPRSPLKAAPILKSSVSRLSNESKTTKQPPVPNITSASPSRARFNIEKRSVAAKSGTASLTPMSSGSSMPNTPARSPTPVDHPPLPSTPSSGKGRRSATPTGSGISTPRQRELWKGLLGDEQSLGNTNRIQRMSLGDDQSSAQHQPTHPGKKLRLVDALRPSAYGANDVSDDEEPHVVVKKPVSSSQQSQGRDRDEPLDMPASQSSSQPASQTAKPKETKVGPKYTYSARRTIVESDEMMEDVGNFVQSTWDDIDVDGAPAKAKDPFDFDDMEDEDEHNPMASVHELKARGREQRYVNEIETLLDDIMNDDPSFKSGRRGSMLEFCRKLMDASFAGRFVSSSSCRLIFTRFKRPRDTLFDYLLSMAVRFIAKAEPSAALLRSAIDAGAVTRLLELCDNRTRISAILNDRSTNLAPVARKDQLAFSKECLAADIWGTPRPKQLTPMIAALQTLNSILGTLRKKGDQEAVLTDDQVRRICEFPQDTSYSSVQLNDDEKDNSLFILGKVLSILEAESLILVSTDDSSPYLTITLDAIASLVCKTLHLHAEQEPSLQHLALRLCLNLTNNRPTACASFNSAELVGLLMSAVANGFNAMATDSQHAATAQASDRLLLSLGALINLAEHDETSRMTVLTVASTHLDTLIALFSDSLDWLFSTGDDERRQAEAQTDRNHGIVAYGYLAVFFGNLCQHATLRSYIAQRLPSGSVKPLATVIQQFLAMYRMVDEDASLEGDAGDAAFASFTERLQGTVDFLLDCE